MKLTDFVSPCHLESLSTSPLTNRKVLSHIGHLIAKAHSEQRGLFKLPEIYRDAAGHVYDLVTENNGSTARDRI